MTNTTRRNLAVTFNHAQAKVIEFLKIANPTKEQKSAVLEHLSFINGLTKEMMRDIVKDIVK